jgi:hypothetical protein
VGHHLPVAAVTSLARQTTGRIVEAAGLGDDERLVLAADSVHEAKEWVKVLKSIIKVIDAKIIFLKNYIC